MNFLEGLATTVNRAFCTILGGYANQEELLRYILEPGFGRQYTPFAPLYAQNCPTDPIPSNPPPFSGGQCDGVPYNGVVTITRASGSIQNPFDIAFSGVPGAITGADFVNSAGNVTTIFVLGKPTTSNPSGRYGIGSLATNFGAGQDINSASPNSVVRQDGAPDTCGNPPPNTPPFVPGGNVYNDFSTYVNNEGNTVTIPVALVFGYATLNLDGTLNFPINAKFELNPEFNANFNYSPGGGGITPDFSNPNDPIPSPCSDPGGYSADPSIPAPPDSIPDYPDTPPPTSDPTEKAKLLKGCIVTTSVLDGNETIIFQGDNPDIYIPSLGYVQFLIKTAKASAWTNDIPVKSLRTFIPCPWDGGAVDVRGTPRYGNEFIVTPVYVTRTFNPTYPPDS